MAKVFISYDREDGDFAELLDRRLDESGHDTCMDVEILNAGEDWRDKLDQAIKASDVLVVIMSPEARASEYVAYEWAFALGAGIRVIPVALRETTFHPRLDVLQRLDFTNRQRPWELLLQEVIKAGHARHTTTVHVAEDAPPTVKSAVAALDSLEVADQVAGIKALAATDHPAAREALVAALQHPVKSVSMAAALYFPDHTDPRIVPSLIAAPLSFAFAKRLYPSYSDDFAMTWIVDLGSAATPYLLEALQDSYPGARALAAIALGRIAEKSAIPDLIGLLQDQSEDVRQEAARALGRIGEDAAVGPLTDCLSDPDESVQTRAATALGCIGNPSAAGDLVNALEGGTLKVRAAAAEALGRIGALAAVAPLLQCLSRDSHDVRKAAALALGRIADRRALNPLLRLLQDTNERFGIRRAAAQGLGLLGDIAARDALKAHLSDRTRQVDWDADDLDFDVAQALMNLKCTDAFPLIGATLNHFTSGTPPVHLIEALSKYGQTAVPVLAALTSASPTLRAAAIKTLRAMGTPEALSGAVRLEQQPPGPNQ